MSAHVLRRGVQHDVGTDLEGTLQRRRRERAVDDETRAVAMGHIGQRGQVDDLHERIRGSLRPEHLRLGP
ncbi:hypothetical protein D3C83_91580 [compost metagenome]